jgi:CheY-like chemotaxis protein
MMMAHYVLIVEDDEDVRHNLALLLELKGHSVQTASHGREALARLRDAGLPCLILLDLMMPVMTGEEFRRRQLADPHFRDVPVICMTAAHDGRDRAARLQADAYFQKPVDFDRLLGAVHAHAGR